MTKCDFAVGDAVKVRGLCGPVMVIEAICHSGGAVECRCVWWLDQQLDCREYSRDDFDPRVLKRVQE